MINPLPLVLAVGVSVLASLPGQAGTIRGTTTLSERTCSTRPARDAGFIRAAGQTVRIVAPEREVCRWTPVTRIESTTRY